MSFFPRKNNHSTSHFIALATALSMGLVGCSQGEFDENHELTFDDETSEQMDAGEQGELLKGEPEDSIILSGLVPLPDSSEPQEGILVDGPEQGTITSQESNTASAETASNSIYNDDGNEAAEGTAKNCDELQESGSLALSFSAPSAAFIDDDLTDSLKVSLQNEGRLDAQKVAISIRLSSDKNLDDGDLELNEPSLVVNGPAVFSEEMVEFGKLQPLVGIESGEYVIIVHAQQFDADSNCIIDDSIASLPLQII